MLPGSKDPGTRKGECGSDLPLSIPYFDRERKTIATGAH